MYIQSRLLSVIFPIFSLHTGLLFLWTTTVSFFFSLFPHPSSSSLQDKYGNTALTQAAWYGHDTVIPLLLEADAQIDAQDNSGGTPLIYASANGKEAAVRELLKGNPNLDLKNKYGKTALDYAREKNHQSIVNLLVDHERSWAEEYF